MADDLQNSEEYAFVNEEIDRIIQQGIESTLKDKVYQEKQVTSWVDEICDTCMLGLHELKKPFKYVVTCVIMQKNGAGIHSAVSCHWDNATDGTYMVKWPSDKQKDLGRTMNCIVTISGLAF